MKNNKLAVFETLERITRVINHVNMQLQELQDAHVTCGIGWDQLEDAIRTLMKESYSLLDTIPDQKKEFKS